MKAAERQALRDAAKAYAAEPTEEHEKALFRAAENYAYFGK